MIKKLYSSFNGNRCTYCSNLLKMTDVTAHQEGSGSHEEVQHSPSQHRNIGLLPGQRLQGRPAVEKIDTWTRGSLNNSKNYIQPLEELSPYIFIKH